MTVASSISKITYIGNGAATTFDYPFRIFRTDDLRVILTEIATGIETILTSGYTVSGAGDAAGGTVTYPTLGAALAATHSITVMRVLPLVQETDIQNSAGYYPKSHEDVFDRLMMVAQQQQEQLDRTLTVPAPEAGGDLMLPPAVERAGGYLAFDAEGRPIPAVSPGSYPATPFAATLLDDEDADTAVRTLGALSTVATLASLKALTPTASRVVQVRGFDAEGDDGSGVFWWDAASAATDNGGTVVASDVSATGRWRRLNQDGAIWGRAFGIRANGANMSGRIQAAFDAAVAVGGATVHLPPGTITMAAEVVHASGTAIIVKGAGSRRTTLTATGNFGAILRLGAGSTGFECRDVGFATGATTTRAVQVDDGTVDQTFTRCKITGAGAGVSLFYSEGSGFPTWHDCDITVGSTTTTAVELYKHNQTWRMYGGVISGSGRGVKVWGTSGTEDVEGGVIDGTHIVVTGAWGISLGHSFATTIVNATIDQFSVSGVLINEGADRVSIANCYIGCAAAYNATAKLIDVAALSGNHLAICYNTLYGGAAAIQIRAGAGAGETLTGCVIDGNKTLGQASTAFQLDSVSKCTITNNIDTGTPTNGSWITSSTNATAPGDYTFGGNHFHTVSPAVFSTSATYRWGNDTGIVMRARGKYTVPASGTVAQFNHGLSRTPGWMQASPQGVVGDWYIGTLGATQVSIIYATAGTPTWHWQAEV